ncbi:MAG: hypothetical protein Q7T30_03830 [Planctomycetota bacterium]|nr:hypothetical protein [Planctomycetota bacterium]
MNPNFPILSVLTLSTTLALAQGPDFLYTTSQNETTLTFSGGTVLKDIHPNDVVGLQVQPCPGRAEKWAPRSCFHTMAGDYDADNAYWEPTVFGEIDALIAVPTTAVGTVNARTVWFSPRTAMGTAISGAPGLRPGDIGRIVRTTAGDGKVQHFIRMEQINQALGLPVSTIIDVDAAAWAGPNQGLYLSLDSDIVCNPCFGPTLLRDGDVFAIAAGNFTFSGTVITAVVPGSAVIIHTEAQMDTFTAAAGVTDRFGTCVSSVGDVEALEIDTANPGISIIPGCTGVVVVIPHLIYTAETLTGGAVLTTAGGGMIYNNGCAPLGTNCGFGPTLGTQIGLRPPTLALGVPSYVNALASTRIFEFAAEAKVAQIPMFTAAQIDFVSPGAMTWVFLTFAPTGPAVVAPSAPFVWGFLGHPDYYPMPNFMGAIGTGTGYGTYTSPAIPFVCDLVFQGVTITPGGTIEASTPTMVEVF